MKNGWANLRLKDIAYCNVASLPDDTDPNYQFEYVDIGTVEQGEINFNGELINFKNAPSRARRLGKPGDIIISTVRTYLRAISPIPEYQYPLVFSTGFAVLSPKPNTSGKFLGYAVQSKAFIDQVVTNSVGVSYPSINTNTLLALKTSVPPLPEQERIANYLDRETGRLDTLVAEQENFINLLTLRRKEAVRNLVTGASNPLLTYEDTGVSWLGLKPKEWNLIRTRFLARITTGSGDTQDAVENGDFPFYVRSDNPERSSRYEFDCTAVLTSGDGAGVGKVFHLINGKFMAHQRVYVLTDFRYVLPEYFYHYFSTFFGDVALDGSAKTTVDSVRRWMITEFPVIVPPISMQELIIREINTETTRIDGLIAEAERNIELSKERRAALITAAVTGQIEVD